MDLVIAMMLDNYDLSLDPAQLRAIQGGLAFSHVSSY
jgi:hypothetical protein